MKALGCFDRLDSLDQRPFLLVVKRMFDVDCLHPIGQIVERVDSLPDLLIMKAKLAIDYFGEESFSFLLVSFHADTTTQVDGVGDKSLLAGFKSSGERLTGLGVVLDNRHWPAFQGQSGGVLQIERAHRGLFTDILVIERDRLACDHALENGK